MKKVLLTGACGSVGHHALEQLVEKGYEVTVFEQDNCKNRRMLKKYEGKIKIIWGDIRNKELVTEAVKGQDVVIHLAVLIPPKADIDEKKTESINYGGTENIVNSIKEVNPNCFLTFSSSISVYGDRLNNPYIKVGNELNPGEKDFYAQVKVKAEKMIQSSGINYTIFRLSAVMDMPKTDPLMFHMPLDTSVEIITGRDTARAFVNGVEKEDELNHKIFNLGGGEKCRTTYRELLRRVLYAMGGNSKYLKDKYFHKHGFHCGYYADNKELYNIVHHQQDTFDSFVNDVKTYTNKMTKLTLKLFSWVFIRGLNLTSDIRKEVIEQERQKKKQKNA